MEMKEYFSERIRELRKKHNLTQQELGEIVGVIKQTVNAWEILQRVPQADVLCKLANYFKVSVDYLLGQTDNPERN